MGKKERNLYSGIVWLCSFLISLAKAVEDGKKTQSSLIARQPCRRTHVFQRSDV